MTEKKEHLIKGKKQEDLVAIARRLASEYPRLFNHLSLQDSLSDFSELSQIVSFVESEENCDYDGGWEWLQGRELSQFIYLGMAVCVALHDPDYLKHQNKNLKYGLREELAKIFSMKGNTVSPRLKVIKREISEDVFFSQRVTNLAGEYLKQRDSIINQ
jgi:hypothetical protein